ncbi:MAG: alpha-mannosidase [Lachnospiraceae bacterium]|nr:alpha-mannosidase [Lachnospiraceae bacterium]
MLEKRQTEQMMFKLRRLKDMTEKLLFLKVDEVEASAFQTRERFCEVPDRSRFERCPKGSSFEGEESYTWFLADYRIPEKLKGNGLFVKPLIDGYEGLLFVNGVPSGSFTNKINVGGHGNHYCSLFTKGSGQGERFELAIEYYAHHYVAGTSPFEDNRDEKFVVNYSGIDICVKNERIWDFYFNLYIACQIADHAGHDVFRQSDVLNALKKVHETVYYDIENVDREIFYEACERANEILKEVLAVKNSESAPHAGLVGHSHMDTAWLWNKKETLKKCARTYANTLSLMEQYPDYTFIQSSSYHTDLIKKNYPSLFEKMKEKILEGRYEPNGGVWVECDCNIPTGEAMVRQFVWGQRYTKENFGYLSDAFWLPDTFGYSAALPQIMVKCGIRYFLTTKIAWCDTTEFPYDTFIWKGIDGSRVLAHFNRTHVWPDPKCLITDVTSSAGIKDKRVTDSRLIAYGYGDGGGGPEFEMIEVAERLKDCDGVPKTEHTTVSGFMHELEKNVVEPSVYTGELYLELHRGTLTNKHEIKRNNRKAEVNLHNLEYLTVRNAVRFSKTASDEKIRPRVAELLVNQFHDILPGTCIGSAHDECFEEMGNMLRESSAEICRLLNDEDQNAKRAGDLYVKVENTLGFDRNLPVYVDVPDGMMPADGYKCQKITDLDGRERYVIRGLNVPAYGNVLVKTKKEECNASDSVFQYNGHVLETPLLKLTFDENGFIASCIDKEAGRELRGDGHPFNSFLLAEDVPVDYDNWNIDADIECKFQPTARLLSEKVVADGNCEFRIRREYSLTEKSSLVQDMILWADSRQITFETIMDWNDDHRLLKVAFDTNVNSEYARCETQFGCVKRPTTRNTAEQKAKFEVSTHKYTDISEPGYGVSLLNDCKYGISVIGGALRLSLHKGGNRPDVRGDKGKHKVTYAFLPHEGGFNAKNTVLPAYELNFPVLTHTVSCSADDSFSLIRSNRANVMIETVKPAEDNCKGFVIRVYEAEGTFTNTTLFFGFPVDRIFETDMLEETIAELPAGDRMETSFKPFEIKTYKVLYK